MAVFAVTEVAGPNWDASRARREQVGWDEHAAFMDALVADGVVVLGGPIGDGERILLVVEAADEREVEGALRAGSLAACGDPRDRRDRALDDLARRPQVLVPGRNGAPRELV